MITVALKDIPAEIRNSYPYGQVVECQLHPRGYIIKTTFRQDGWRHQKSQGWYKVRWQLVLRGPNDRLKVNR